MGKTHKVRTTIQPDVELTVDDAELLDLERSGILIPEKKTDDKKGKAE